MIVKMNSEKNFLTDQANVYSIWKKENKKLHLSLCNDHKKLEKIYAIENGNLQWIEKKKQRKKESMQEQDETQMLI